MKQIICPLLLCLLVCGCGREQKQTGGQPPPDNKPAAVSAELARSFPLLPLIEKRLWAELLEQEKIAESHPADSQAGQNARRRIRQITEKMRRRHPFSTDETSIRLGEITYLKKTRRIEIPAEVHYPDARDKRHPGELELVLCSDTGRTHETLLVTPARPLHLELLLHLAGFQKTEPSSLFRVRVLPAGGEPVAVESLIETTDGDPLPDRMLWQFTGSGFDDLYSPDQTGDLLILWRAHDSVLSVENEKIAYGEIKLRAKKHSRLKQGAKVTVVLTPVTQ